MRSLSDLFSRALIALIPRRKRETLVERLARCLGVDLLPLAHRGMGIMKFKNADVTGERHFVENILPRLIRRDAPVCFDVGANVGDFSALLRRYFPAAQIFAFEPVAATYQRLFANVSPSGVKCLHLGLGAQAGLATIYLSEDERASALASLYPEVSQTIHRFTATRAESTQIQTLEAFCRENGIAVVDFLKVDTEGHEMEVLTGGRDLIQRGNVRVIQFEFNEMNVMSRVFLKDFFELLADYRLYRLNEASLIPMAKYQTIDEIFQFQNIVAVHKELGPERLLEA